jgi:hypothetical protein
MTFMLCCRAAGNNALQHYASGSLHPDARRSVPQAGLMASTGQVPAQTPQSTHLSGSIVKIGEPSLIASTGQESLQVPQAVHFELITYAMMYLLIAHPAGQLRNRRTLHPGGGKQNGYYTESGAKRKQSQSSESAIYRRSWL